MVFRRILTRKELIMTCDWCNEEKEEVESIKINNKWRDICRECLEHGVKIEVVSAQVRGDKDEI